MKKIFIAALTCAMMSLTGCDKLKDAVSRDIKVNNVKFAFDAPVSNNAAETLSAVTTRAGTENTFTVTRTVNLSEMGSSELMEYAAKINKVKVNSSLLKITTTPAGSYTVTDVKVTAGGVAGSLDVPSYAIGSAFTAPANMGAYTELFIAELISAGSVTVTVSGKSDAPSGTIINISYESDVLLTASLL